MHHMYLMKVLTSQRDCKKNLDLLDEMNAQTMNRHFLLWPPLGKRSSMLLSGNIFYWKKRRKRRRRRKTTAEHKNLFQISTDHPHYVKEKLLRTLTLLRQVLKEMLALKLSVEKVVYECGAEGSRRANRWGVIIRCFGIREATKSCNFVPFSAWGFQP